MKSEVRNPEINVYLIIPCYNEEHRLPVHSIRFLVSELNSQNHQQNTAPFIGRSKIILVNDGSRDLTLTVLESIRAEFPDWIEVLDLPQNVGKGEAVRAGLRRALARIDTDTHSPKGSGSKSVIGYTDADFAAPPSEVLRVLTLFSSEVQTQKELLVGLGSRVNLLGSQIKRTRLRHYLGRVFATIAAIALDFQVYDTQCGLKFFTDSAVFRNSVAAPFRSRWAFDVELIARLLQGGLSRDHFKEFPLLEWADLSGSKLGYKAMAKAALDLFFVGFRRITKS